MPTDQFADFRDEEPITNEAFAELNKMVKAQVKAEADVAQAEATLKQAQQDLRQIVEFDLPGLLEELGLSDFTTASGLKVEVEEKIRASIGNRKTKAFAWLIKHGHSGLIKRTVSVAFNVSDGDTATDLLKELRERDVGAAQKQEMKVEAASLTSFVKAQLKAGKKVPADIFGIHRQRYAKITTPQ